MRILTALAALAISLAATTIASAVEPNPLPSATFAYFGSGGAGGLTLSAAPGDTFIVRWQTLGGSCAITGCGTIPSSGTVTLAVAPVGPYDDLAQFVVEFHDPALGTVFVTGTVPTDGDKWYWD
jgi:hypothetical protein